MESKVALLLIVGLLYAVHQTSAGESQSLLLRASATLHEKSPEIILRPSDPLHMNEESVTSVLLRPHVHINEDFSENRITPSEDQLAGLGLRCQPGRTVIKLEEAGFGEDIFSNNNNGDNDDEFDDNNNINNNVNNNGGGGGNVYDMDETGGGDNGQPPKGFGGDGGDQGEDGDYGGGDGDEDDDDDGFGARGGDKDDGDGDDDGGKDSDITEENGRNSIGRARAKKQAKRTNKTKRTKRNKKTKRSKKIKRTRKSHMNFHPQKDETCKVCVCSAEGKNQHCSRRPAMNVNECLRMAGIMENFQKNVPYDVDSVLAYRIRRAQGGPVAKGPDYIWHDDEIPYAPNAKCQRSHSYYTNDPNANDSSLEKPDGLESLLDYSANDTCFFCVCSTSGMDASCIPRSTWFCEYFRFYRQPGITRDVYRVLFKQDRPSYFRQLSWRLRRAMDSAIYDFIDVLDNGGDTLCCDHPSGHRRTMHNIIRNRVMSNMKKKTPRENLLNGSPRVIDSKQGYHCMPFVSTYSDCTESNQCTGCTRCTCSAEGEWACRRVEECPAKPKTVDASDMDNALKLLYSQLDKETGKLPMPALQPAHKSTEDLLLDTNDEIEQKIVDLMNQPRAKRDTVKSPVTSKPSPDNKKLNQTIKFYNTVDDLNEDSLKNSNLTGTLRASKLTGNSHYYRRTGLQKLNITNATEDRPLQIEPKEQIYNQHIAENKIDDHIEDPDVIIKKDIEIGIVNNQTQKDKDGELSKILVNELKSGKEMIGDKHGPIMSNITFTPENDTLTAMAFIAGNLLNKLWSMQKDNNEEINMQELEKLKHEKIADLIELFKEPLTIRQELVLKSALEKLSQAMDHNVDPQNITLCENIAEVKRLLEDARNSTFQFPQRISNATKSNCGHVHNDEDSKKKNTLEAVRNINKVLDLVKKYEVVNQHLNDLQRSLNVHNASAETDAADIDVLKTNIPRTGEITIDSGPDSLNMFGNLLSKITKLLLPNQIGQKFGKKVNRQNAFTTDENKIRQNIKNLFKYDLGNATLSIKDKLILDYLTKLDSNPRILSEEVGTPKSRLSVEGGILLNLSEFFKIKTFVDLLKHLDSGKGISTEKTRSSLHSAVRSVEDLTEAYTIFKTTIAPIIQETTVDQTNEELVSDEPVTDEIWIDETTVEELITESAAKQNVLEQEEREVEEEIATELSLTTIENVKSFKDTKTKFKSHLKEILEDLIELQREYGINNKEGELRIADALPCIYKILQTEKHLDGVVRKENRTATLGSPTQRIAAIFESLKEEFKAQTPKDNRRVNKMDFFAPRSKSALVLERLVKSLGDADFKSHRRNENIVPSKTYAELKQMMNSIDNIGTSNTYKTAAMYHEVQPAEKLMLLQTLYTDIKKYLEVLPFIKSSIDILDNVSPQQKKEIVNFVENAAISINLDDKVLFRLEVKNKTMPAMPVILKNFKSIMSEEVKHDFSPRIEIQRPSVVKKYEKPYRVPSNPTGTFNLQTSFKIAENEKLQKPVSVTREELLNQLVKNRIELYLQTKKERGDKTDLKHNVARNILHNMELGNYEMAREMYKVFAQTTESKPSPVIPLPKPQIKPIKPEPPRLKLESGRPQSFAEKIPLVQFQDLLGSSKNFKALNRDLMLKQLLELQNLKLVK